MKGFEVRSDEVRPAFLQGFSGCCVVWTLEAWVERRGSEGAMAAVQVRDCVGFGQGRSS